MWPAGIGFAERPRGQCVGTEHKARMASKPAIHADSTLVAARGLNLIDIKPHLIAFRLTELSLAEEEDVDDDVRTSIPAKAALGQTNTGNQIGGPGDMLPRCGISLVHHAM